MADGAADRNESSLASLGREEVGRRLIHVAGALVPLAYVAGLLTWSQLQVLALGGLAAAGVLEFVRLVVGVDWWVFQELTREYERANLAGYFLYMLGATAAIYLFDPSIAVPAVLMLSIVDPISGLLADNEFREPKRPTVLAVAFALSGLIALLFVPLWAALLGAAATTIADGLTPVIRGHAIDDNLTIPIASGAAMWVGMALPV